MARISDLRSAISDLQFLLSRSNKETEDDDANHERNRDDGELAQITKNVAVLALPIHRIRSVADGRDFCRCRNHGSRCTRCRTLVELAVAAWLSGARSTVFASSLLVRAHVSFLCVDPRNIDDFVMIVLKQTSSTGIGKQVECLSLVLKREHKTICQPASLLIIRVDLPRCQTWRSSSKPNRVNTVR